jgi:Raf kinase inhibitor-like YbhB/YbcL family protein
MPNRYAARDRSIQNSLMRAKLRLAASLMAWMLIHCVDLSAQEVNMTFRLASTAFTEGGAIPSKHTCEGADISPPLTWSGVPSAAKSLALIVDDPDAPDPAAPRTIWVHWVVYDLPSNTTGLAEGVDANHMPDGAKVGLNDWKKPSYGGPCPPIGRHRYFHKLYALDTTLPELQKPTKAALEAAMKGHILAEAQLIGTYQKKKP